jgi:peptidoglycan/LPS O-acetylase OafA/YrhL
MSKESKRIPSLDGIRALSISLVILCHFGRDVGWGDPFDLGSLGVRIFFVISGYLITGLLLKEREANGRIRLGKFYFRRTLRIFPAFYFYIGCILLMSHLGWTELTFHEALPAILYVSNYSQHLVQNVAHTWSLSTEEQFYLIWPVVFAVSGRRTAIASLLALLIIAPLTGAFLSSRLHHLVPAFFNGPIGIGCMLALVRESLHRFWLYKRWIRSKLGLLLPAMIFATNVPWWPFMTRYSFLVALTLNVSIALFIDWAVTNTETPLYKLLNSSWMVAIGVASYSLYLWQQPFLALKYTEPSMYLAGPWTVIESPPIRLAIIAICTSLSFFLIERPMIRLRARLEHLLFGRVENPKRLIVEPNQPVAGGGVFGISEAK